METTQKELRRYGREQVLEEGTLQVDGESLTVDVLDVSVDQPRGRVRGFGILAAIVLMPKRACQLHLPTSRHSGRYLCEAVYCQDTGFGYRSGLLVQKVL